MLLRSASVIFICTQLDLVYFNGRKRYNFSQLRAKDTSKIRKQSSRTYAVEYHLLSDADIGGLDDATVLAMKKDTVQIQEPWLVPQQSYDPPLSTQESHSCSILDEYVVLLRRYEAITMVNYERLCLPEFSSRQHKLQVEQLLSDILYRHYSY